MYCPKCASLNADEAGYCRACGAGLRAASQSLRGHVPVVLASKLDEYLEKPNERIRRDAILTFLFGATYLLFLLSDLSAAPRKWSDVGAHALVVFLSFGWGLWSTAAYKRSLALNSKSAESGLQLDEIHCPTCGEANESSSTFCRGCGENLEAVVKAMTRRLPAALTDRLDRYILKQDDDLHTAIMIKAIYGVFLVMIGIAGFLAGEGPWQAAGSIVLGVLMVALSAWDRLVEKRGLFSIPASKLRELRSRDTSMPMTTLGLFPSPGATPQTIPLDELARDSTNPIVTETPTRPPDQNSSL